MQLFCGKAATGPDSGQAFAQDKQFLLAPYIYNICLQDSSIRGVQAREYSSTFLPLLFEEMSRRSFALETQSEM